jgi:hypothetical protein
MNKKKYKQKGRIKDPFKRVVFLYLLTPFKYKSQQKQKRI